MKRFLRSVLIGVTFITTIVYFLACCTPYISPLSFWPMTFLGLGFPIIAVCFLILIVVWLFVKWKLSFLLIAFFIIAGYSNIHSTFAFHRASKFINKKDKNSLRILSWNVRGFAMNSWAADSPNSVRRQMINYIKTVNPDIMLFQEFVDWNYPGTYSNIQTFRDSLQYKYYYTTKDSSFNYSVGTLDRGCAIFSKTPILDSGKTIYNDVPESVGFVDIAFQNKPVRIFTTHLLSTGIHPGLEYHQGYRQYSKVYKYAENVLERLKRFDRIHTQQALQVRQQIAKSKTPVIVSGDLNSVPSSFVYHTIKGNLTDAFIDKGSKLGHTYIGLSKTLRIDYVFVDPAFKIMQVTSPRLFLSDHFPVVTDIQWKQ